MQDLSVCQQNNYQYYMGDSEWWDKRFKNRRNEIMPPENQLKQDIDYFRVAKRFFDLACGDERNSIYLAQMRYEVCAVDFCEEAFIREVYPILSAMLNDNGIIWVNGFANVPEDNSDVKENDILQDTDFELLLDCKLLSKENYAIGQRTFVRYIWKKGE